MLSGRRHTACLEGREEGSLGLLWEGEYTLCLLGGGGEERRECLSLECKCLSCLKELSGRLCLSLWEREYIVSMPACLSLTSLLLFWDHGKEEEEALCSNIWILLYVSVFQCSGLHAACYCLPLWSAHSGREFSYILYTCIYICLPALTLAWKWGGEEGRRREASFL